MITASKPVDTPNILEPQMTGVFPNPILTYTNKKSLSLKERDYLLNLEQRKNMGNTSSVNESLFKDVKLKILQTWIRSALEDYVDRIYCPKESITLNITQSWVNVCRKGEYHHLHSHPNSLVSGVYYVQSSKNDKINFTDNSHSTLDIIPREYNLFNSRDWWMPAMQDTLVLFPSSLFHRVSPVEEERDRDRVSLSFNTFPTGILGSSDNLSELEL